VALAAAVFVARERAPANAGAPPSVTAPADGTPAPAGAGASEVDDGSLQRAIAARADGVPVTGRGVVLKLLRDDREGSPHQRILLRVDGGGTVLIAHNLELAPRVEPLAVGDMLEFSGEYVWNEKGGVVHWTHPDPRGHHRAGWIRRVVP
jgi:hypothetical protein